MTEKPEALQLANDRPWQQGDDLYDWAIDAEEMLRKQHAEIEQLREQNTALDAACAKLEKERDEMYATLKDMADFYYLTREYQEKARAAIAKCQ